MNEGWCVVYYYKQDGSKPVKEYIDNLSPSEQAKILSFVGLLKEEGPHLHRPYADLLEDGIHELRIKLTGTQVRVLYFFCYKNIIVLTNVFTKRSDKVPKRHIKRAKVCRADYLSRVSEKDIRGKNHVL